MLRKIKDHGTLCVISVLLREKVFSQMSHLQSITEDYGIDQLPYLYFFTFPRVAPLPSSLRGTRQAAGMGSRVSGAAKGYGRREYGT